MPDMAALSLAQAIVLAMFDLLPAGMSADAAAIARTFDRPEPIAARPLEEQADPGCPMSAVARVRGCARSADQALFASEPAHDFERAEVTR